MKKHQFARRSGLFVSTLVYAALLAACNDGTAPLVPAAIQVVAGNAQTGIAGTLVPVAPSVKVVTASGRGVKGVTVTFAPAPESGTVVGGSQVTDASGVATVTSWTLGTKAGPSTLTVSAGTLPPVTVTATTAPGEPAQIKAYSGDVQNGVVGGVLGAQPAVRISDAFDNGVGGIAVTFATQNGGSVERAQAVTDANGVASAGAWTLGTTAGPYFVNATATGALAGVPVSFRATATADGPFQLAILTQPSTTSTSGERLTVQPVVEFRDRYNNPATLTAPRTVTASVAIGTGTLSGTTSIATATGRATFTDLSYSGSGPVQLRFTSDGFPAATSSSFTVAEVAQCAGPVVALDYTLGQMTRYITNAAELPRCLDFSATRNAGQQYIVLFENLSPRGGPRSALFAGTAIDNGTMQVTVSATGSAPSTVTTAQSRLAASALPADAVAGWDFGEQPVYEISPEEPAGGAPPAFIKRNGEWLSTSSSMVAPQVGDTLRVYMEGISRLGIGAGQQRAVVRLVTPDIIIAEDARFSDPTFTRSNGVRNSPILAADLQQIASEYSAYAKVQADNLFENRYNSATEYDPGRPIAVHTMMYGDGIWGYTYSSTNYFLWDYWVNTTDGVTKQIYQHAQRNADNLFMHESAHIRHYGLTERNGHHFGNNWHTEGFARASERLPMTARLLGNMNPARTANLVLPLNPAWAPQFFVDEIPSYWYASTGMYDGYTPAAFVFDYFADQVALAGGDWRAALREFLLNGDSEIGLNAAINARLGIDFGTLFTRARIALYTDDIGTPGLPAWTQYQQLQLRASRRTSSTLNNSDPRNFWPKIVAGTTYSDAAHTIGGGAAFGYVIDGSAAGASSARFDFAPTRAANGVMTIVRIR